MADPQVHNKVLSGEIYIKMGYAQLKSRVQWVFAPVQQEAAGGSPVFTDLRTVIILLFDYR